MQAYIYLCSDTVEQRIAAVIARKRAMSDLFVNGIAVVGRPGSIPAIC